MIYCPSCLGVIEDTGYPIIMLYVAPDEDEMGIVAHLCYECVQECQDERKFIAIESIVNARIARKRNGEKRYSR